MTKWYSQIRWRFCLRLWASRIAPPHSLVVEHAPNEQPETLPAGVDAMVRWDSYLTLKVSCQDDQGDRLSCIWTCDDGALSADYDVEMRWNEETSLWEGNWVWYPPEGATPSDIFTLTCEVKDGQGGVATGQLGAQGHALVVNEDRIIFTSNEDGDREIYAVNADGSNLCKLTDNEYGDTEPQWFPDGTKFAFESEGGFAGSTGVYVANQDGSGKRAVMIRGDYGFRNINSPAVSPGGNQIAFFGLLDGSLEADLYLVNADGTHPDNPGVKGLKRLTFENWTGGGNGRGIAWRPDGRYLVFGGSQTIRGEARDLWQYDLDTDTLTQLTFSPLTVDNRPRFSPDGSELIWHYHTGGDWGHYRIAFTPGATFDQTMAQPVRIDGSVGVRSTCWSLEGDRVAVVSADRRDLVIMNVDGTGPQVLHRAPAGATLQGVGWTQN